MARPPTTPKKRIKLDSPQQPWGSPSPSTQTTPIPSTPRSRQRSITEFFTSPTRNPARQLTIHSFVPPKPRTSYRPIRPFVFPDPAGDKDERLAPVPSSFAYRGSPTRSSTTANLSSGINMPIDSSSEARMSSDSDSGIRMSLESSSDRGTDMNKKAVDVGSKVAVSRSLSNVNGCGLDIFRHGTAAGRTQGTGSPPPRLGGPRSVPSPSAVQAVSTTQNSSRTCKTASRNPTPREIVPLRWTAIHTPPAPSSSVTSSPFSSAPRPTSPFVSSSSAKSSIRNPRANKQETPTRIKSATDSAAPFPSHNSHIPTTAQAVSEKTNRSSLVAIDDNSDICSLCKTAESRKETKATMETEMATMQGAIRCQAHGDPGCLEESCSSDFFEEWDHFEEGVVEPEQPRRAQSGLVITRGVPVEDTTPSLTNPEKVLEEATRVSQLLNRGSDRPYLSCVGRAFLVHMGDWPGFFQSQGKSLLHVDFSPIEAEALRSHLAIGQPTVPAMSLVQDIGRLVDSASPRRIEDAFNVELPGRTKEDVRKFMNDCHKAYSENVEVTLGYNTINLDMDKLRPAKRLLKPSTAKLRLFRELGKGPTSWSKGRREITTLLITEKRDTMQPWKIFTDGSSDILDISWSPDGRRFSLSCCTFNDVYNRPGNLMFGSLETSTIKMMDGHKVNREAAVGQDPYLYTTVPCARFTPDGAFLVSGSYDKTVKVWSGGDGAFVDSANVEGEVANLATSQIHQRMFAIACKNGKVVLLNLNNNGNLQQMSSFESTRENLEAATLAWGGRVRPNWVIAGFDTRLEHGTSGDLLIFDIQAQKFAAKVSPNSQRQFDLFLDEEGKNIKSQIRMYNIDGRTPWSVRADHEFDSEQADINKVTWSPCKNYVTASGTDGSTSVWDIRFPRQLVHSLRHGTSLVQSWDPEDDTGVAVAFWGPTTDRFYTGSSDGVVKIWDIRSGDPFLKDFCTLTSQVMSAAFNPDMDMLMVGESSGHATLFSTLGDSGVPPEKFDVDIRDVTVHHEPVDNEMQPDGDSGVQAARDLVNSGRMIVDGRFAWATGF
ncbi:hypothetical protein FN846DRAFT_886700 [Sphaerosporella brunnea]|uniref:WD40-repeat-containing domain protein n=1 Tax=Sphaerosporella brunnea TaxID=1250544 RepID=A0A5J5F8K6_9PEZI|nr:hypothetical protein FN846DRAFT_886700 [Sphaerosporella brunnea]